MRFAVVCILSFFLVGWVNPSSGVVSRGDGIFSVTRHGAGAWVSEIALKEAALKEAMEFCGQDQKKMNLVFCKGVPAGKGRPCPLSAILFKCE